jgi:hypothetical protein
MVKIKRKSVRGNYMNDIDKMRIEVLNDYFNKSSESSEVRSREIASWTAIVFYLSSLGVLFKFVLDYYQCKLITLCFFISLSVCFLLYLFLFILFIHTQFGKIYSLLEQQMAYNFWRIIFIGNFDRMKEFRKIFSYPYSNLAPSPIMRLINILNDDYKYVDKFKSRNSAIIKYNSDFLSGLSTKIPENIRTERFIKNITVKIIFLVPFQILDFAIKILSQKRIKIINYSKLELEESILYNLLIVPTLGIVLWVYKNMAMYSDRLEWFCNKLVVIYIIYFICGFIYLLFRSIYLSSKEKNSGPN